MLPDFITDDLSLAIYQSQGRNGFDPVLLQEFPVVKEIIRCFLASFFLAFFQRQRFLSEIERKNGSNSHSKFRNQ